MSKAAVKWAKSQDLPFTEKAVLIEIAEAHSPRWGVSKPSQQAMARNLGLARETINRVVKRLQAKGVLVLVRTPRQRGRWEQCVYLLNPSGGGIKQPGRRVTQDHTAPCDSDQTRHRVTQDHTSIEGNVVRFVQTSGGWK